MREDAITTPRLVVRRFTSGDLADFLSYQSDPAVRRYLPGAPMTADQALEYLAAQAVLDDDQLDAWHGFAVHHVADDRVIGDVGVWLASDRDHAGDVGFQFDPRYHGQGYAREAMEAFLGHLFGPAGLRAVTAGCDPGNDASWGLMLRLGLRPMPGTEQSLMYGLTREQWLASR
ncbi:GNAT family N-acetyltransferase [Actinoplanes sp. M2I2]|uniref:GNAT family N-acetyltransferase n=1 Tax=Actinoplanes sp. M2I2 TaxID=1734444 RepID=UPI0020219C62|nr:GNAT family N-acetyltransferase [Actinoplanes sp. M2I2]